MDFVIFLVLPVLDFLVSVVFVGLVVDVLDETDLDLRSIFVEDFFAVSVFFADVDF